MLQQQPSGPYRLAGNGCGALLALELARRLRMSGEPIELLAVLGTEWPLRQAWSQRRREQLARWIESDLIGEMRRSLQSARRMLAERWRAWRADNHPPNLSAALLRGWRRAWQAPQLAPAARYDGEIVVFAPLAEGRRQQKELRIPIADISWYSASGHEFHTIQDSVHCFRTKQEAEAFAVEAAKAWIDARFKAA